MMKISICVCTRNRPEGILTLLKSIDQLYIPQNITVKVIVIENNIEDYSGNIVKDFAAGSKIKILYFLEKNQGISYARNRSVKESGDADFCCFVDDDQSVEKNWLAELVKCQQEFDADGVWGQNPPIFNTKVPKYVEEFHNPEIYEYGTKVSQAYTNCLLLKKSWLDKFSGPFDLRLNFTGGEDSFLTSEIIKKGGIIRFNPNAIANEIVPAGRTTIRYILKRNFRTANTKLLVQSLKDNEVSKYRQLPRLVLRFCNGVLLTVPFLFLRTNKLNGLLKISNALGGFMFIFGRKNIFYK